MAISLWVPQENVLNDLLMMFNGKCIIFEWTHFKLELEFFYAIFVGAYTEFFAFVVMLDKGFTLEERW